MAVYTVQDPQGATHQIEGPDGASEADILANAQALFPPPSELASFGQGALNNLPLAQQALAIAKSAVGTGDYSTNIAAQRADAEAAKAANPKSYGAGATFGALAPLAIPGVGEGVEGAMALGAANGVGDTDVLKNPGEAVLGAGMGAGIGAAGSAAGSLISKALPSPLENAANSKAVQTVGLAKGIGSRMAPEDVQAMGQFIRDNDLMGGNSWERLQQAKAVQAQIGKQVGEAGVGSTPLQDSTPFTDPLQAKMSNTSNLNIPTAGQNIQMYRAGIQDIQQNGTTFEKLQQLKNEYGDAAFNPDHTVKQQAAADVYGQIKNAMNSLIAGSKPEYQKLMTQYKIAGDVVPGLEAAHGLAVSGGTGGTGGMLGSYIRKLSLPVRAVAAPALVATGHPTYAAMATLPEVMNPAVHSAAASAASTLVNEGPVAGGVDYVTSKIMSALQSSPQSLGKFAKPLAQAAQNGSQGIAATHFILSQQYPEYNSLMEQYEPPDNNASSDENAGK